MSRMTRRQMLASTAALSGIAPALAACAQAAPELEGEIAASGFVDGVALARQIANGETTAEAAVEASIARFETANPKINAAALTDFDGALETARAGTSGPFAGVPTFIKDLEATKGMETKYGSQAFRGYIPEADGAMAAKWRAAGMVFLGKSTSPEIGLSASTEPVVTGATRNPWNPDHIPGGSSGGAAALTAARVVPFAHASDGGGSIRIPASCCGLFGLKPSRGRLGRRMREQMPVDISVGHAVTWTVRDSAALFAIAETGEYETLGVVTEPLSRRLRIGFAPEPLSGQALDPDVRAKTEAAAALCEELGHEVVEYSVPYDGVAFTNAFTLYWAAGAAEFAQSAMQFTGKPLSPDIVEPLTLGLVAMYQSRQAEMPDTVAYLKGFEAQYHAMFEEIDVLLTPTVCTPPPLIGAFDPTQDAEITFNAVADFAGFTPPMNVAGAASMSVPLFQGESGLPIGTMFSGRRGDDGLLLQLAYELEAARPWIGRVPDLG